MQTDLRRNARAHAGFRATTSTTTFPTHAPPSGSYNPISYTPMFGETGTPDNSTTRFCCCAPAPLGTASVSTLMNLGSAFPDVNRASRPPFGFIWAATDLKAIGILNLNRSPVRASMRGTGGGCAALTLAGCGDSMSTDDTAADRSIARVMSAFPWHYGQLLRGINAYRGQL